MQVNKKRDGFVGTYMLMTILKDMGIKSAQSFNVIKAAHLAYNLSIAMGLVRPKEERTEPHQS